MGGVVAADAHDLARRDRALELDARERQELAAAGAAEPRRVGHHERDRVGELDKARFAGGVPYPREALHQLPPSAAALPAISAKRPASSITRAPCFFALSSLLLPTFSPATR